MCDPISIIGLGLTVGMAVMQYENQQDMVDKQNAANDAWLAYQQRQSKDYLARDEQLRTNAEAARESSLNELSAGKQQQAQTNEQQRLQTDMTPDKLKAMSEGDKQTLNDELLSGSQDTSDQVKGNIQRQLVAAAQEARQRINALAAVQSYGGSQFGLTNRANAIFDASGQNIRMSGDQRQGQLAAYNVAKGVEPIKYVQGGGGGSFGAQAGNIAAGAAKSAGSSLGNMMASSMISAST